MKSQFVSRLATCRIILFGLILWVGGCASAKGPLQLYEGQKRPQNEVITLLVPTSLEILTLDGKEVDLPYFAGKDYTIEVLPGSHTVDVMYKESWGGPTSSAVVVSDVHRFRLNADAGSTILFRHDGPDDLVTASRFSDLPKIWLVDSATDQRVQPYATEKYVPAIFRGKSKSTVEQDVAHAGNTQQASSMVLAEEMVMQQDALKRLQFWWKMASKQDRKAFKAWLEKEGAIE